MISFVKNLPVVIHQLLFLFAQLFILSLYGIGFSGSLAYIGAISTFVAVLVSLRWDIEIMVSNYQSLSDSLSDASITIILMITIISIFNMYLGNPLPLHIILSAIAIAIHELLVSILFVQKRIYAYSLFRSIPALALVSFALIGYQPEVIWPASFFFSVFFLFIFLRRLLVKAIFNINVYRIKNINILNKFSAAITATSFSFFSALFVIVINFYYGNDYVGLWANTIRIFNSVVIFLLAACLPFFFNRLRGIELNAEKIKMFLYLWILFLPLIIFSFIAVSHYGIFLFSLFEPFNFELTNYHLSLIFLTGIAISFIGSSHGLDQAIGKSIYLLSMIIVIAFIGYISISKNVMNFNTLILYFLFLTLALLFMIMSNLSYYLIYKKSDKN